jgi:ribosomal protein L40E
MTEETLGYVELEWTCEHCGAKNPGTRKTCAQCGAAMAESEEFEVPEQIELINDEKEIQQAKSRPPDIHCPYCGTRNLGDATRCKQCGGDLSGGDVRETGHVLGSAPGVAAREPTPVTPGRKADRVRRRPPEPAQPAADKPSRRSGVPVLPLAILALVLACAVGFFFLFATKTSDVQAVVQDVTWTRSIAIEQLQQTAGEGWRDQIPPAARDVSCQPKLHHTQQEPVSDPNLPAKKVCGTPYIVDQGSGYGKVVRDCEYEVYADWCQYTYDEWKLFTTESTTGHDLNPYWPEISLRANQREGERTETYQVLFDADGKQYRYRVRDVAELTRFEEGSRWLLTVNALGGVTSVKPAK